MYYFCPQIQTEAGSSAPKQLSKDAEKRLADFLKKIEPCVVKELDRVIKSHDILRAIESNAEEELEPAACLHTIAIKPQVSKIINIIIKL
jgi:hypothetical protein